VIDAIGPEAFERGPRPIRERGIRVPSYQDHMRFSPGTEEMPWVAWHRDRDQDLEEKRRRRRYASARKRRRAAAPEDDRPTVERAAEWSTSFDVEDWRSFGPVLFRELGGELRGPLGKALVDETVTAPHNHEESVSVRTDVGPVEVRWFIDDIDAVDLYLFGPSTLPELIDRVHGRWGDG
jgi:hypothetical protein